MVVDWSYESVIVKIFKEVIGSAPASRDLKKEGSEQHSPQETSLDTLLLGILGSTSVESASHPSQFQTIVFYVDGGVSNGEVREMRRAVEAWDECAEMEVVIASSGIIEGGDLVRGLFQQVL